MGSSHAGAYARFGKKEHVEIAGILSRSATKARALAKRVNAPWFTDPRKILRDESIDAIDVTVPSGLHRTFVVSALAHGKHVFCETPMALTLRDADAMIDAARANRRSLMVAQVMRFVADYQQAHAEAVSGKLGKPRIVVARRLARPYWSAKRPRPFRIYGEPLTELSIHDFDVANWILGRPRVVRAHGVSGPSGVTEHAMVAVGYRGGSAYIEGSAMMPPGFPFTTAVRVQCDAGVFDHVTQFTGGPIPKTLTVRYTGRGLEKVSVRGQDPYEEECRHFVRAVLRKADASVLSGEGEREALRIALAARESIRNGREIDLPN
jgi:UDP-N-acetylglucosamine 3-dehydrogenase